MTPLVDAAVAVQELCEGDGFRFCFIGGLAVLRWGEPRLTRDVGLTIMTGFGGEQPVIDALLAVLPPRIDDARDFALANRVLLLRSAEGVAIDVALGAVAFEERALGRASYDAFLGDQPLRTCSAEDLVAMKAFAGREQDWLDLQGVVSRLRERLDRVLVLDESRPLLALTERPTDLQRLQGVLAS